MPRRIRAAEACRRDAIAGLVAALVASVIPVSAQQAPSTESAKPAEGAMGQPHELSAQPALRIRGQSTWDEGFEQLRKAFELLAADIRRLGLVAQGAPLAHFIDSDDLGFTYEAYLRLAVPAAPDLAFAAGIDAAPTPAGRAMQFTHEAAYDDIDSAYEAITAWLDEKGLQATGRFVEEYLALPEKSDDPAMRISIYVFLK